MNTTSSDKLSLDEVDIYTRQLGKDLNYLNNSRHDTDDEICLREHNVSNEISDRLHNIDHKSCADEKSNNDTNNENCLHDSLSCKGISCDSIGVVW